MVTRIPKRLLRFIRFPKSYSVLPESQKATDGYQKPKSLFTVTRVSKMLFTVSRVPETLFTVTIFPKSVFDS